MDGYIMQKPPTYGVIGNKAKELEVYKELKIIGRVHIDGKEVAVHINNYEDIIGCSNR